MIVCRHVLLVFPKLLVRYESTFHRDAAALFGCGVLFFFFKSITANKEVGV